MSPAILISAALLRKPAATSTLWGITCLAFCASRRVRRAMVESTFFPALRLLRYRRSHLHRDEEKKRCKIRIDILLINIISLVEGDRILCGEEGCGINETLITRRTLWHGVITGHHRGAGVEISCVESFLQTSS